MRHRSLARFGKGRDETSCDRRTTESFDGQLRKFDSGLVRQVFSTRNAHSILAEMVLGGERPGRVDETLGWSVGEDDSVRLQTCLLHILAAI